MYFNLLFNSYDNAKCVNDSNIIYSSNSVKTALYTKQPHLYAPFTSTGVHMNVRCSQGLDPSVGVDKQNLLETPNLGLDRAVGRWKCLERNRKHCNALALCTFT